MEYTVVVNTNIQSLIREVRELMALEWETCGGIAVASSDRFAIEYYQAMERLSEGE